RFHRRFHPIPAQAGMDRKPCMRRGLRSIPTPAATCPTQDARYASAPYRRIEAMLDDDLKTQLAAYLERLQRPVVLVASLDEGDKSRELLQLLEDIRALSDKVTIAVRRDDDQRKPSFAITTPGEDIDVRFAGIPLGHEFTSLVLALLQVGGHPSKAAPEL